MFTDSLKKAMAASGGSLCVGLDPHLSQLPDRFERSPQGVAAFLDWIVDETSEHACAFKPNSAFYEALGSKGWDVLAHVIDRIHRAGRPVILDAKRGDIASTAAAYAHAAFVELKADAITLVPYMGEDALVPFLDLGGFAFVLTSPSNPSSRRIVEHGTPPLEARVASMVMELEKAYPKQTGLVVGATHPASVKTLDEISNGLPWLVPGLGAQGGQASEFFSTVRAQHLMVVNASRSILFAPRPNQAAGALKQHIQEAQIG